MSPQASTEGTRLTANVSKRVYAMALPEVPLPGRQPRHLAISSQGTSALASPRSQNASPSDAGHSLPHSLRELGVCVCARVCVHVTSLCHAIPAAHNRLCPSPATAPLTPDLCCCCGCCGSFCPHSTHAPPPPLWLPCPLVRTEVSSAYRQVPPLHQDVKFTRDTAVITGSLAQRRGLPGSRRLG